MRYQFNGSKEWADKKGYRPIAGPYRPDTEASLLAAAIASLDGADIALVLEPSSARDAFIGISIYRHASECWLTEEPAGRSIGAFMPRVTVSAEKDDEDASRLRED